LDLNSITSAVLVTGSLASREAYVTSRQDRIPPSRATRTPVEEKVISISIATSYRAHARHVHRPRVTHAARSCPYRHCQPPSSLAAVARATSHRRSGCPSRRLAPCLSMPSPSRIRGLSHARPMHCQRHGPGPRSVGCQRDVETFPERPSIYRPCLTQAFRKLP
jgi:hypothetical protein